MRVRNYLLDLVRNVKCLTRKCIHRNIFVVNYDKLTLVIIRVIFVKVFFFKLYQQTRMILEKVSHVMKILSLRAILEYFFPVLLTIWS